jgi:hypothetical protein
MTTRRTLDEPVASGDLPLDESLKDFLAITSDPILNELKRLVVSIRVK